MDADDHDSPGDLGPGYAELEFAGDAPLLRGLRKAGDEAQLTRVIGRLAATSERFASGYADVLLTAAAQRFPRRVRSVAPAPRDLQCAAEYTLGREQDASTCAFTRPASHSSLSTSSIRISGTSSSSATAAPWIGSRLGAMPSWRSRATCPPQAH
jgi:hypothetical protein